MTVASDPMAGRAGVMAGTGSVLHSRDWDRLFVVGGVLLVPIPILVFYALRSLGLGVATCEDLVTLLVMLSVGGPHVFATYTRTYMNPGFRREDRALFWGGLAVMTLVLGAAISSAFFDVRLMGTPPIYFVLTFFFFWAGVHIVQQNSYCVACYDDKDRAGGRRPSRWWGLTDYALMLLCLYPIAMFRMSMGDPADPTGYTANPDALATQIVVAVTGSAEFADQYVFRIGRVAPVLPSFMRADVFWILITGLFAATVVLFVVKTRRELRNGTFHKLRFQLVAAMAVAGFFVPLMPNLDTSFQGMNAWHSFQYLGLLWLMNRKSMERGEIDTRFHRSLSGPGSHWRFYGVALAATVGLLALVFGVAFLIQEGSGGRFLLFGHGTPVIDPATGREAYRPGALLLAYYMIAFSLLLVHYLHDGFFFFRKKYLVDAPAR